MFKKNHPKNDKLRVNDRIRFSPVIVVNSKGENLGSLPLREAKNIARNEGLDLVEVSPHSRPPVCKVMDYGKFQYEQSKKTKKSKQVHIKEIMLKPNIGDHDLNTKINQLNKFIAHGDKVQIKVRFSGRENAHKELGFDLINKVLGQAVDVTVQKPPKLEGRCVTCFLEPSKSKDV